MNILIIAYASEPGAGSEYGVGWMVPVTLAEQYSKEQFYVLTRSRCKEKIDQALAAMQLPNLHYLFYDIPRWLFYKNEMQSNWGEQINYLLWQLLVRKYIRKQHQQISFDVIHHLTFNQYRTPSPGFWMDVPFVFGPVGGAETIAPAFWQDLEAHSQRKEAFRQKGKDLKIFGWFTKRRENKKMILCSCAENYQRLKPHAYNSVLKILPAIAYTPDDFDGIEPIDSNKYFEMIYAGKAWDWKGIHVFLKAVQKALPTKDDNWRIKLVGIRFEEEQQRVMGWVKELGIEEHVELIPFIQRSELLRMMKNCSLSVYPAFRDSGSMSVLEASALGCPTLCFDAGGQDVFPDDILLKVAVGNDYETTLNNLAEIISWAYAHKEDIKNIGLKAQQWVSEHMTWKKKATEFMEIYKKIAPPATAAAT